MHTVAGWLPGYDVHQQKATSLLQTHCLNTSHHILSSLLKLHQASIISISIISTPQSFKTEILSKMPHHPSEEEAPTGITEKIAKDPSSATESTASDHEDHHNEHAPGAHGKASALDFQSKGPQIPMNMDGMSTFPCSQNLPRRNSARTRHRNL